jgi:hypothetical protein
LAALNKNRSGLRPERQNVQVTQLLIQSFKTAYCLTQTPAFAKATAGKKQSYAFKGSL